MLKDDIKNYYRQFAKTLSICFQWNTTHRDLVTCSYVRLEQLNVCAKYEILSVNIFVLLDKVCRIYKVF